LSPAEYDPEARLDDRWFGPTERRTFGSRIDMTADDFLAQLSSRSYLLTAPASDRARILGHASEVAAAHARDGRLSVPLAVTVLRARRA
jgi:hypothetical protein